MFEGAHDRMKKFNRPVSIIMIIIMSIKKEINFPLLTLHFGLFVSAAFRFASAPHSTYYFSSFLPISPTSFVSASVGQPIMLVFFWHFSSNKLPNEGLPD
jgi:hypothetical protein